MKPFNKKIRNLTLVLILLMPIYPNSELLGEQNIVKIEVNENIKNKDKKAKTATLLSFIKLPFVYVNRTHFQ